MRRSLWITVLMVSAFYWPRVVLAADSAADTSEVATASPASAPLQHPTHSRDGRRIGVIAGAAAGAPFLVLAGYVGESICEYDCPHITALGYVGLGALGAALGAVTGGLLGTLVGGMIPAGVPPAAPPTVPPAGAARRRPVNASVGIQAGLGRLTERPSRDSGSLYRVNLLDRVRPWLAVGPELSMSGVSDRLTTVGGVVQARILDRRLSPYLVGDLGAYFWKPEIFDPGPGELATGAGASVSLLGSGIGAGLLWGPGSGRAQLGAEARYHWTPQHIEHPEAYRFVDVVAGARWNW